MHLCLLGPIELVDGGSPVALGSAKERLVLAALGLAANRTVPEDALVDALWGDVPPRTALRTLQAYVSRLRKSMAPGDAEFLSIGTSRAGYVLRAAPDALDVTSVATLTDRARRAAQAGDHAYAATTLRAALGLWRGAALGEFRDNAFARTEANRLDELQVTLNEERIDAELACGHHQAVVADLEAMCSQHPLRERLWGQRIVALYRCGRQSEALRAYEQLRLLLAAELGVAPSPDLRALEQAVLDQSADLDRRGIVASSRSPDDRGPTHNLPAELSSFVGRDRELTEVSGLVSRARLVTLAGPGGVGKTRLGLRAAAMSLEASGDGAWFVDLAPITDPSLVAASVAKVLWTREEPGKELNETLVDAVGDRKLLVVLDNCEHVVAATAAVATVLLRGCRGVTLLATSRQPLGIDGEHVYRVPPLSTPAIDDGPAALARSEAVRLFVERAHQHNAAFSLDGDTGAMVGRLCRRLDGIPFAIELAAARLRSLSAHDLDACLDERFELLTNGTRGALPRHQTLQALIDWSWDLLPPAEQDVLARLSAFAGGFDLAAAAAVCGCAPATAEAAGPSQTEVLDHLDALVEKSLIDPDFSGRGVRYRMLETIRDYAAAKLARKGAAERTRIARAHRDHFLALAEAAEPHLRGHDELQWIDRLEIDIDNMRVALTECLADPDPDPDPGLRLAAALSEFWNIRGYGVEGSETLQAHLGRPDAQAPTLARGRALAAAGHLVKDYLADYPAARELAEEALTIAHDEHDDALAVKARYVLAAARNLQGDHTGCLKLTDEALPIARRLAGAGAGAAAQLLNLQGWALDGLGRDGRGSYEEAALRYRQAGDRRGLAAAVGNAGFLALNAGDHHAARAPIGEALRVFEELGDRHGHVTFALNAGYIEYLDGHDNAADHLFRQSLDLARRIAARSLVACAILGLALTAARAGNTRLAATLHGVFDSLNEQLGAPNIEAVEARLRTADHLRLRALLGEDSFADAYQTGRGLPLVEALNLANRAND